MGAEYVGMTSPHTTAAIRVATPAELDELTDDTPVSWATVVRHGLVLELDAVHLGDDGTAAAERADALGDHAVIVRTVTHPTAGTLVLADSLA